MWGLLAVKFTRIFYLLYSLQQSADSEVDLRQHRDRKISISAEMQLSTAVRSGKRRQCEWALRRKCSFDWKSFEIVIYILGLKTVS